MQNIKILIQLIESKALNIQKHVIELRKKNEITKMIKYELALTSYQKLEPKVEKLSW